METSTEQSGNLGIVARRRFEFLGRFIARAYILDGNGILCPRSLHPLMYESIVLGQVATPEFTTPYSPEDVIPECEWLAVLRGNFDDVYMYRPDPRNAGKPLYRSEHFSAFGVVWGLEAVDEASFDSYVGQGDARLHTQRLCARTWLDKFAAPMRAIIAGFHSVIPQNSFGDPSRDSVPAALTGKQLKILVEGPPVELTTARILDNARWDGTWKVSQINVFKKAVQALDSAQLIQFLIFVTGNSREPLGGFEEHPLVFKKVRKQRVSGHCPLAISHTCFDTLDVPDACLRKRFFDEFVAKLKQAIRHTNFGFA